MGDFYLPLPVGQYMYFLELPQQNATGGVADTTEINLLTVLAAQSPRSRCRQVWFLPRPLFLACKGPPSRCVLTWLCICVHQPGCLSACPNFLFL